MQLRSIIIDDESAAISSIKIILEEHCQNVSIVGSTTSPEEGIKLIYQLKPNLVFLDISMPEMNGFELLQTFPERDFEVIFITAFDEHAVKAFKVNAIDYILKPVSTDEITEAVKRTINAIKSSKSSENIDRLLNSLAQTGLKKVLVNHTDGTEFIEQGDIICFKASGNYTEIYMNNKKKLVSKNLKEIEQQVGGTAFFRSHNSWLINLQKVVRYNSKESYVELEDEVIVPISRRNKEMFFKRINDIIL